MESFSNFQLFCNIILGNGKGRNWIPSAFSNIATEISVKLKGSDIIYWHRPSWTFHAKGIWISNSSIEAQIKSKSIYQFHPESLKATVLGSSNFGQRSESLDVESNVIFMFPKVGKSATIAQNSFTKDWNHLIRYANPNHKTPDASMVVRCILPILKKFM